jgi:uncharacterized OsmC-like protein
LHRVKITLLADDALRLEATDGVMTIEAATPDRSYSPFHMLASALAYCTFSVLHSWATHAKLDAADLAVEVRWAVAEDPHRVGRMDVRLAWPSLPAERRAAAQRAAATCAVHRTLEHPPQIAVEAGA